MKKKNILDEFKQFAVKGNVIDLAIGVIIGGAFGKIVTSIVNDLIMPPIGVLLGGVNFSSLKATLKSAYLNDAGEMMPAVTLNYGNFLQTTLDFLIIAWAMFLLIKLANRIRHKEDEAKAEKTTKQEKLLTEIRDLLQEKGNTKKKKS